MQLKILHKLFLALLLCTGGTLLAMVLLIQWSLNRSFLDYLNQAENERLERLVPRLVDVYRQHNGWMWLQNHPRIWQQITSDRNASDQFFQPPPPPPPHRFDEPERADRRPARRADFPPPRPPPRPPDPLQQGRRTTLFDVDKQALMGDGVFSDAAMPIQVNGKAVGWLGIKKLRQVRELRDVNFLQQQSRTFFAIATVLLLLATLLALMLARHLVQPMRRVTATVRELAAGGFQAQVAVSGRDEIADLADDVNTLARTLANNQQARQRWMADISHELRTPLAIVWGELEALEDGIRPFGQSALKSLQNEIKRLNALVADLHELSLADQGALTYQMRSIDLADIIAQVIETFATQLQQHQLTLTTLPTALPTMTMKGDQKRLIQLFSNLFENTVRYTDPGGQIELRISASAERLIIVVADSAPSVAAADCPRLFERLYRLESSRNRNHGGSGLGLAICKSIVEAHAGTIHAEPSPLGGLAVIIELPI